MVVAMMVMVVVSVVMTRPIVGTVLCLSGATECHDQRDQGNPENT
jgi:hypothetical protein